LRWIVESGVRRGGGLCFEPRSDPRHRPSKRVCSAPRVVALPCVCGVPHLFAVRCLVHRCGCCWCGGGIAGGQLPRAPLALGAAAFIAGYGILRFRSSTRPSALTIGEEETASLWPTLVAALGFTFLNPYVYLDTLLLIGGASTNFTGPSRGVCRRSRGRFVRVFLQPGIRGPSPLPLAFKPQGLATNRPRDWCIDGGHRFGGCLASPDRLGRFHSSQTSHSCATPW